MKKSIMIGLMAFALTSQLFAQDCAESLKSAEADKVKALDFDTPKMVGAYAARANMYYSIHILCKNENAKNEVIAEIRKMKANTSTPTSSASIIPSAPSFDQFGSGY